MSTADATATAEVRAADDARIAAMLAGDVSALDRLLDEQLTYMHSTGHADTKQSYLDGVRNKVWEYKEIRREDMRIAVSGGTATIFCHLMAAYHMRGEARQVDSNALAVWSKASGSWRLLAVLSSGRPK
mgnify:CR=1 FL=1